MINQVKAIFENKYGVRPGLRVFYSPGRVNLIGEHIDYNGGFVFPCALSIGTYGAVALRTDRVIRFYSGNFAEFGIIRVSLDRLDFNPEDHWANYAKGIIQELIVRGCKIDAGFDLAVYGDLPNSSGLSSSASVELLVAVMMNELFHLGLPRTQLALLSKKVENEYIGVNCGIMDQFVIANGQADHALLLNCTTLDYQSVPLVLGEYAIVICNSKVKRGLIDSKYNERRSECDAAKAIFKRYLPIKELCDLSADQFVNYSKYLDNDLLYRRSRHAVTENLRTKNAVHQLIAGDLKGFGAAMTASHKSLRDDYEVSCPELDTLVELALANGSLGSRMTGAGFGGCTVNLVRRAELERFRAAVTQGYLEKHHLITEIYVASPANGTKEIGGHR